MNGRAHETAWPPAKTILVVDDQEPIRRLLGAALSKRGYRCLLASGANEAMELFSGAACGVDLLITDLRMPGMHGSDLASRLAGLRAGLRVLIISGFRDGARLDPAWRFMPKPFQVRELLAMVESMLDCASAGGRRGAGGWA